MLVLMVANGFWSRDFVSDKFNDGRRLRILTAFDDCARECLALVADTSRFGLRVARELERISEERGEPRMIASEYGSNLTSNAILQWAARAKVDRRPLRLASLSRTLLSKASTVGCETSS